MRVRISMSDIVPNPDNVRKTTSEQFASNMASNISRFGLFSPIRVIKSGDKYMIRAGHSRYAALQKAGVKYLIVGKDVVIDNNPKSLLIESYMENKMRQNLHILDDADGLFSVLQHEFGDLPPESFIDRIKHNDPDILAYMSLYDEQPLRTMQLLSIALLPEPLKKLLRTYSGLSLAVAFAVSKCDDESIIRKTVKYLSEKRISSSTAITMLHKKKDVLLEIQSTKLNKKTATAIIQSQIPKPLPEIKKVENPAPTLDAVKVDMDFLLETIERFTAGRPQTERALLRKEITHFRSRLEAIMNELP